MLPAAISCAVMVSKPSNRSAVVSPEALRTPFQMASFRWPERPLAIRASTCSAVGACIWPSPFVAPVAPRIVDTAELGSNLATTEPKKVSRVR